MGNYVPKVLIGRIGKNGERGGVLVVRWWWWCC